MSLIKDMLDETSGYTLQSRAINFLSPKEWLRLHRWRVQRADRGWSDRDCWGMGDHVAQVIVEMLGELHSERGMTDWEAWFEYNIDEHGKGAYKNMQQVIDDISGYLEWQKTSWADDLTSKGWKHWYYENGKKATEADITHRINKHSKEGQRLYKKAQKGMGFFGRHFTQFWD